MDQNKKQRIDAIITWSCATLAVLLFFIWYFGFVDSKYQDAPIIAQLAIAAIGAFSGYKLYECTLGAEDAPGAAPEETEE